MRGSAGMGGWIELSTCAIQSESSQFSKDLKIFTKLNMKENAFLYLFSVFLFSKVSTLI